MLLFVLCRDSSFCLSLEAYAQVAALYVFAHCDDVASGSEHEIIISYVPEIVFVPIVSLPKTYDFFFHSFLLQMCFVF